MVAAAGGFAAKLTGGKFANGAFTAAFAKIVTRVAARGKYQVSSLQTKIKSLNSYVVKQFKTPEAASQFLIAVAKFYGIDTSAVGNRIYYSSTLPGDGYVRTANGVATIFIGTRAFRTFYSYPSGSNTGDWGYLGATLAHEIEVHVNAQLGNNRFYNFGQGELINEVEAYDHQINNAGRFGLSAGDISSFAVRRQGYFNQLTGANQSRVNSGKYTP